MNRNLCIASFVLGLLGVAWVGVGYIGSNPLALGMTVIIAAVYGIGAFEMWRYRLATSSLARALRSIPGDLANLGDWLDQVHPSLQGPVRLRVEGERVGLPGPALTPYLIGLLVMLGMLGTFIGMVVTLNGAVFALEGTTDLQTMRASLAAPIKGLGLAFGTSVAGVASSAMLGLISALCRRERGHVGQLLEAKIATVLRGFSLVHQRQETFKALQFQAQVLPDVVDKLQTIVEKMDRQNQQLNERMITSQQAFHRDVSTVYADLAGAVDKSLRETLAESARSAGATIKPLIEATMQGLAREAHSLHAGLASNVRLQLEGLADRVGAALATLQSDLAMGDQARLAALTQTVEGMAGTLQREWRQAGAQTFREATQLMAAAAAAPRAAADVIGELRQEVAASLARDNAQLAERGQIMATLNGLLESINRGAAEQRASIETLVTSSTSLLDRVGNQLTDRVGAESVRMADMAAQVAGSAVEVSSLSDAFGFAVQQFSSANDKVIANLQRLEAALEKAMARSDDQLAYYVAQAREVIDLSLLSQQQIIEDLRQRAGRQERLAAGVS